MSHFWSWIWIQVGVIILIFDSGWSTELCNYYKLTQHMDCNNQNLEVIQADTFPVNIPELKDLLLQHNGLRKLEYNVFHQLTSLLTLDLSDNLISNLDYRLFINMTELETLNVRNNRLTSLTDGRLFQSQTKLTSLVLDFNHLKHLSENVLQPLVSLKSLFLTANLFQCDCELKKSMEWCETKVIETGAICASPSKYANYSWNFLHKEDCNVTESAPKFDVFDSRCNYTASTYSLDCTNVPLLKINGRKFPSNITINNLILQSTGLSQLEYGVFNSITELVNLDLSKNYVETLDEGVFEKISHLQSLNLSYNKLLSLREDTFKYQSELTVLKLDNNHLTHLNQDTLMPLASLKHLDLSENLFECNCELYETMMWCEKKNISTGAMCAFPRAYQGMSWTVMKEFGECIGTHTTEILSEVFKTDEGKSVGLSDSLLIMIICLVLLLVCSVLIALWFYVKKRKPPASDTYDDVAADYKNPNDYEKPISPNKNCAQPDQNLSWKFDPSASKQNSEEENMYEEIENIYMNGNSASYDVLNHELEPKKSNTDGKETGRTVPSYLCFEEEEREGRKENVYILK